MKKPMFRSLVAAALSCLLSLAGNVALAADVGGTVKGRVTNDSGAGVGGAVITLTHTEKGVTRSTESNADGEYVLRNLPVGAFTVTVSAEGYNSAKQENVAVLVDKPAILDFTLQAGSAVETVTVIGEAPSRVDMSVSTGGMSFDDSLLDLLPVDNGYENMVLMTPGTVDNAAGTDFKGANSIGGASSAENVYYLNGINVTQLESGLGSLALPWEALQQTSVQTSGLDPQYGGALGGVINSVSKSGSNEFNAGVSYRLDPESLSVQAPSIFSNADPSVYYTYNAEDESEFTETNAWVSGPIVKDKAFFYVLVNPRETNSEFAENTRFFDRKTSSDRWFANFEWYLSENHSLSMTAFNTERDRDTRNFVYNSLTKVIGAERPLSRFEDGGDFKGVTYHGEIASNLALNVIYGVTQEDETTIPGTFAPLVQNCLVSGGACTTYSTHTDTSIIPKAFERKQQRIDLTWDLTDHRLSFGLDKYNTDVFIREQQNGVFTGDLFDVGHDAAVGTWRSGTAGTTTSSVGTVGVQAYNDGVTPGTSFVQRRVRYRFTDSTVNSSAFYAQDVWQISSDFTLNYGFRLTDFDNTITSGEKYIDLTDNFEPRISAIWDIDGDGKRKLSASIGRYFQPVASRMNFTQGSQSVEYFDYYQLAALDTNGRPVLRADGSPERGAHILRDYRQQGFTDPNLIVSKNLEAMYSDQLTLSYESELSDALTGTVRFTYNELGRSVEDTDYGPVLVAKLAELGITDALGQGSFYIVSNPGTDVEIAFDFDQDGDIDEVTLEAEETQLAKPVRKYVAWDFVLEGRANERLTFNASYTWSHNYGNSEGLVKTDNEQADPGWTSDYDYGEVLDHAYGNLPNDRRHQLKFSGVYDLTDNWAAGLVFRAASGAPLYVLNGHPTGVDSCAVGRPWEACGSTTYVGAFYDANGNPAPRGTTGNLPWQTNFDASVTYTNPDVLGGLVLKATVYNIFEASTPTKVEQFSGPDYNLPIYYQDPRYVSLTARLEF